MVLAQVGEATGPPGGLFHPLVGLSACQPGPSGAGEDADSPGGWSRQGMTRAGTQRGNSREDEKPAARRHPLARSSS